MGGSCLTPYQALIPLREQAADVLLTLYET